MKIILNTMQALNSARLRKITKTIKQLDVIRHRALLIGNIHTADKAVRARDLIKIERTTLLMGMYAVEG